MNSLDKCSGSCHALSSKICVPKKRKIHFKIFNMLTNEIKLKQWQNILYVIVNAKSILQHVMA